MSNPFASTITVEVDESAYDLLPEGLAPIEDDDLPPAPDTLVPDLVAPDLIPENTAPAAQQETDQAVEEGDTSPGSPDDRLVEPFQLDLGSLLIGAIVVGGALTAWWYFYGRHEK